MSNFVHHNHPAFTPGQVWSACDASSGYAVIVAVKRWARCSSPWHYDVQYTVPTSEGARIFEKDLWNFQVRYFHPTTKETTA